MAVRTEEIAQMLCGARGEYGQGQEIRKIAESEDYIEHVLDRHEIRSFIVSIKRNTGSTGPPQPDREKSSVRTAS